MALIDDVRQVLSDLKPGGWNTLFAQHGIDIDATDLEAELGKALTTIDRSVPGFEDFAADAERGVEPGKLSHSLVYHALASPAVDRQKNGTRLTIFPTLKQLEVIEDYVFAAGKKSLASLAAEFGGALSVVVFACEYRPASQTSHRRHADIMFSRTGVARTGTEDASYDARLRGFVPFSSNVNSIRVLPARYVAYLAVAKGGDASKALPMRFQGGDGSRSFMQPVHKLFAGPECLSGLDLNVQYRAQHVSEKGRRIHLELQRKGISSTGADPSDLNGPPYRITSGLAGISSAADAPSCLVLPNTQAALVEPAEIGGQPAKFRVPPNSGFSSSVGLSPFSDRQGPEFVHVRTEVKSDGTTEDLNDLSDVEAKVNTGNYFAQHYLDHTADGWVKVECPEVASTISEFQPAYSLVSAPDFYPLVNQRELTEWTESVVSAGTPNAPLRNEIWQVPPDPLCDDRLPANQELPETLFDAGDSTMTAIVSMPFALSPASPTTSNINPLRRSCLPDDAAGVFAPGWDVSTVTTGGITQFAAYGLGSPFPEDAKLCAALSAFWPAVAPDISRSISPIGGIRKTVTPLVDQEIGIGTGAIAWDGVEPLKDLGTEIEYPSMQHVDYVAQGLTGKLSIAATGSVAFQTYVERILAMVLLYRTLANLSGHGPSQSLIYSFKQVPPTNSELISAQSGRGVLLPPIYQVKVSSAQGQQFSSPNNKRVRIPKHKTASLFISPNSASLSVLHREDTGPDAGEWKFGQPLS